MFSDINGGYLMHMTNLPNLRIDSCKFAENRDIDNSEFFSESPFKDMNGQWEKYNIKQDV